MTSVFIVRPFGNRSVPKKDKTTGTTSIIDFDFNRVETELIRPAMNELFLTGGTTGEVFEAGDIRDDMFSELLLADVVIADITIYNANVYYELGIRHALRDKRTVLIKCPGFDDTPFDIIGYRYVSYDRDNPAASLHDLVKTIEETLNSDRKDSPVFNILPHLKSQDPERYLAVPEDFINELRIAAESKFVGKLSLLADEVESCNWNIPALRLIGEALYKIKAFEPARLVWEKIIAHKPIDIRANDRLASIYQRLAETEMDMNPVEAVSLLIKSDIAIETVFKDPGIDSSQRADAYALKGRNAKTRWINSWRNLSGAQLQSNALQSLNLDTAFKNYEKGFYENLNHYYSGINALGLLVISISLAELFPDTWELSFDSKELANNKLTALKKKYLQLSPAVQVSITAAKRQLEARGTDDIWVNITQADFTCLTSSNPLRVANTYTRVLQDAGGLNIDAVIRQLRLYQRLNVKTENIAAALKVLPEANVPKFSPPTCLLFTGHMIDKPGRKEPRFPPSMEAYVKNRLREKILEEVKKVSDVTTLKGIAGAACGGDILFHELCLEMGIKTELYLALPQDKFKVESVAFAGVNWIERFNVLYKQLPHCILSDTREMPKWLRKKSDYTVWERNNLWQLNSGLVNGGLNMTLIALWDGVAGDGPGGTADMVNLANERGATVKIIPLEDSA